jgi:hypothetical protein
MVRGVEVFGGMFVLRRIAAAYMPAFEAKTQVYPCIPDFQTILTTIRAGRNLSDSVKMCTWCSQGMFLSACYDAFLSICCFLPSISNRELSALPRANAEAISMAMRKLVTNDSEIAC